ncbi:MAG: SRPBCC family protein [Flavobacteriales bacterium]|jgi:carbon monoxide dehydrogenase subunit G|nr:SRPBCC family protein [Flavobacteriales bacterium]
MIKKILLALLAIVVLILIVAAFQPDNYHVERSATVVAPPEAVFAQVNDFHNWQQFNPFQQLDPNAKVRYEGPEKGTGAKFLWEGNSKMGKGSMTITGNTPNERVDILLHFDEPMEGDAHTSFILEPAGTGTKVTWSMDGTNNYLSKIMCLFMDMDKMIGTEYEKGLAKLGELPAAQ